MSDNGARPVDRSLSVLLAAARDAVRPWCADALPGADTVQCMAVTDLVRFAAFDLVDQALRAAGPTGLRVACSFSEDDTVCVWDSPLGDPAVHVPMGG